MSKAKSYGVYEKDTNVLVEGGFFSKHAAELAAEEWSKSLASWVNTGSKKEYVVKPRKEGDK